MPADAKTLLDPGTGWLLLVIFGVLWIALGMWWGRRAKNLEGFLLAGRNVGLALGAATAMATWVTSNTVMLAPAFALEKGIWGLLAYATASFGLLLFAPVAFRIHQLLPKGFTSGDFVRLRYGKVAWVIFLVITMVYSLAWLVSMGTAGGKLLETLAGVPYLHGMSVILLVCVTYTLFGGLYAVIGTDFIQSILILVGIVIVGVVVLGRIDVAEVHADMAVKQPALLQLFMPVALLSLFNNLFFGFGEVFHNNVWWSRVYAMRRTVAPKAFALAGLLWLPVPVAAGFIAIAASPLGINVIDPDTVGPLVAGSVLGTTGAMLVFVVVFCSLASSIDSLLAASSDLLAEDVFRGMIRKNASDTVVRRAAAGSVILLGVLTWLLCGFKLNLLEILFLSGPLVASTIWPIIAGLYWERTNRFGVVCGLLLGSGIGLWAYFAIGWFSASLIGAAVSMLCVSLATWLRPGPPFRWDDMSATAASRH